MAWYSLSFSSSCSSSLESNGVGGNATGVFISGTTIRNVYVSNHGGRSRLPVGLQLHPAQLHAHGALRAVGLVRDGGAERADPRRGHGVVVGGDGSRSALVGGVSLRLGVLVNVVLIGQVTF